jgi:hypothetical protein
MAKKLKKTIRNLAWGLLGKPQIVSLPTGTKDNAGRLVPLKADAEDFQGRFREIISDPLNLLIRRDALAGCVNGDKVVLHNGLSVPASGAKAYYGKFSDILVLNRGVHEPLEEFAFQQVLDSCGHAPLMIELGAYWGHYSMWCKSRHPNARLVLVEPEKANLDVARHNFAENGFEADFIQAFVGSNGFKIDAFMAERGIAFVDILHSDIQGFELEMLHCAEQALKKLAIGCLVISTHNDELHYGCLELLRLHSYRINLESNWSTETTSHDGFILASVPGSAMDSFTFNPLGRHELAHAKPEAIAQYVNRLSQLVSQAKA